jgi:NAD(P)-dependent dehydrogenase (short-subunit alcohol dehydrogenase family)
MGDLDGKVALITGATQAMGEAIARRLAAAVATALERFGGLDIIVNNAAVTGTTLNVDGGLLAKAPVARVAQQLAGTLTATQMGP